MLKKYVLIVLFILLSNFVYALTGDFNNNCEVDLDDFFLFAEHYNESVNYTNLQFDLDDNSKIDVEDFFIFADGYYNLRCKDKSGESVAIIESQLSIYSDSEIIEQFYEEYGDDYDFLVIYTDFDRKLLSIGAIGTGFGKIIGIRQPNYFGKLGSNGKLKQVATLGDARRLFSGPLEEIYPTTAAALLHEIGHYWCCYVHFREEDGNESDKLLQGSIHWHDELLDVGTNDPMGGRTEWTIINKGVYRGIQRDYIGKQQYYSNFSLYLMGFLPKQNVNPVKLIVPGDDVVYEDNGELTVVGNLYFINITDIIHIEGERIPPYNESQKNFRIGFILWTRDKSKVSDKTIERIDRMRNLFEEQWRVATRNLSSVYTSL